MKQSQSLWQRALPAIGLLAASLLVLLMLAVRPVHAAGIVVNSAADLIANNGECTLREAMNNANSDSQSGSTDCVAGSGADTITFAADYTITLDLGRLPIVTTEMTITGNGAANTIIQGSTCDPVNLPGGCTPAGDRVLFIQSTGNLTLNGLTIRHGQCANSCDLLGDGGGGILNNLAILRINNSVLTNNQATNGGAIYDAAAATTITDSEVSHNQATNGGAIYHAASSAALSLTRTIMEANDSVSSGGAINSSGGPITITDSYLPDNHSGGGGGVLYIVGSATTTITGSTFDDNLTDGGIGGGAIATQSPLAITNSTFSGNSTLGISYGGAIATLGSNAITINSTTFAGNNGSLGGALARVSGTPTYNITNSLFVKGIGPNCESTPVISSNNIADDASCLSATQKTSAEINLGPLDDNGGPTLTHALQSGSHAIDFGSSATCTAAPVNGLDQRGYGRNVDGNGAASANECDAGAYEYGGQPAFCTGFPMSAGTEAELNEAITCYNLLVAAGSYTINLTADIDLTASTVPIDNPTAGIDLLLDGQGFTVDGQDTSGVRPFEIRAGSVATFDDITITGGNVSSRGGGIANYSGTLTVTNSTLSGNSAEEDGGGIYNDDGTLIVTNSTLSGNSAEEGGGGIYKIRGTLTVTNSTLSGNDADYGGGIYNGLGTVIVTDSTLSGNSAASNGGGISNGTGPVTVTNSTISGNSAANSGDEISKIYGTITANAFNVFGHSGQSDADAFAGFTPGASDFNATTDGTPTALTSILDTTLADNGGPTETHALVANSPAIDFGPTADCAVAPVNGLDQRGEPRSIDIPFTGNDGGANLCDAGAYEVQLPRVTGFCPVDENVGYELTDVIGTGQGNTTKGYRTRKLVIPNSDDVVALYGQLAAMETGQMKYVRFLPQGSPKVQIAAPTSAAYRTYAIDWWGSELPNDAAWVKGQFFWGAKANKSPRAFVLWPTYETDEQYANAWVLFDNSSENHVAWEPGFIQSQTQVIDIPETQADGATVVVRVAIVDNDKDNRPLRLEVTVGSDTQGNSDTVPNMKDNLNLYELTFTDVDAGIDEVTIRLTSPLPGDGAPPGDSAAMIGAAVSYACGGVPSEPPQAVNDGYNFGRYDGPSGNLFITNIIGPDDLGVPAATIASFGGESLGGTVTSNAAGSSVALAGGTLTVNADGSWTLTGVPLDVGFFTFKYRLTNIAGSSDATVSLNITNSCLVGDLSAPDC